jgi:1-acyl-sn-glycerol-3-phosphate acyltransferase
MPVAKFNWRVTTDGLENIPEVGGAILAPNHISVLDSFVVPMVLPRAITYVGKAEYLDDWKTKYIFPALGMIPIDRSGGESSKRALDAAASVLNSGGLFGIYPEGTRSRDGRLHKGHTGVARLALRTGSPIVPVGILGTDLVQPPDTRFPKPFRNVHIRFGSPVEVGRYLDRADDRLVLRQITDEVMFKVRALTGQEYVNAYATRPSKSTPPKVSTAANTSADSSEVTVDAKSVRPASEVEERESARVETRSSSAAMVSRPLPGAGSSSGRSSASAMKVRPISLADPRPDDSDVVERRKTSAEMLVPRPL